eukprot:4566867-Amphidinium_carterae.1
MTFQKVILRTQAGWGGNDSLLGCTPRLVLRWYLLGQPSNIGPGKGLRPLLENRGVAVVRAFGS